MSAVGLCLSPALQAKVSRRLRLALSRFGPKLTRLTVRLARAPNPLGGVDQRCRIRALLSGREEMEVESTNGTIDRATARAAERLARRLAHALLDVGLHRDVGSARPGLARLEACPRSRSPRGAKARVRPGRRAERE